MVYISPCGSSFSSKRDDIFELLENDVNEYSKLGNCLVCGDFNARTSCESDFCQDTDLNHILTLPPDYVCDTSLNRNNMDSHTVDEHGRQLLSLCRTSGLRILNGRALGDTLGSCTCYSPNGAPSVIDYVLACKDFLRNIESLHVHPPSELSIHCMLAVSIAATFVLERDNNSLLPLPDRFIWEKTSDLRYQQALVSGDIQQKINCFLEVNDEMSVDQAIDAVNSIICSAAQKANIKLKVSSSKAKKHKKRHKWFNDDCISTRRELKSTAVKLHQQPYNVDKRHFYHKLRRKYKKLLRKSKATFRDNIMQQLDSIKESNPKTFWSLYDQLVGLEKQAKSNPIAPHEWVNHFTNLLSSAGNQRMSAINEQMDSFVNTNIDMVFNELNFKISSAEISRAISGLKPGKSSGIDSISNEMLKAGSTVLTPVLQKLFNLIFRDSHFPGKWRTNTLTPLYKKGDALVPGNYRGIAVSSNVSKLFCSVLHRRLTKHINDANLIPPHQIGYRKKSRTADHIVTLKTLVDKYIHNLTKAKLFTCFVDFKAAFDTISRQALFYKLLKADIGGNFLKIIQNMYKEVHFQVKLSSGLTESFASKVGVKQGCVLSPTLFNLFVSDLPSIFTECCDPVELYDTPISCLMFADDLVLLSQTAAGLQNCLNKLGDYCDSWSLNVNLNKTKVIIFNKTGKLLSNFHFYYKHHPIEIVRSYNYLGIFFTSSGSFSNAMDHLFDQANKALFKLRQQDVQNHIESAFKLFDTLILPIIRYSAEVWIPYFCKNLNENNLFQLCDKLCMEKLQLKFCRYLLGVHRKSSSVAVRSELGRYPLLIHLLTFSVKYWLNVCDYNLNSFARKAYLDSYSNSFNCLNWANIVQRLLTINAMNETWHNQGSKYKNKTVRLFNSILTNTYLEQWHKYIDRDDGKLRTYKTFKMFPYLENYLLCSPNIIVRKEFTKLRISAHQLQIEMGRYSRPKTPVEHRFCKFCNTGEIEDEHHFILACPFYESERETLWKDLDSFTAFNQLSSQDKFLYIMSYNWGDTEIFKHVSRFINNCIDKRKSHITT